MATKKKVSLSVGRGEKLPVTMDMFTFLTIENTFIGKENQIYSEHTRSGLWYIYGHFQADTNELFYIGLGRYNRCNQITRRNKYWQRIKDKHGLIIKILEFGLSKEDAVNKERFYIKKYQPKSNMTIGGEAGNSENLRIRVYAYNKDGSFYKLFNSISEANFFLGQKENDSRISRCLKGDRLSFAGFVWKQEFSNSIVEYKRPRVHNAKKVYRYDLNGNFIEFFEKISDFKDGVHSGISICINKNYTYYNSFWRSYYAEKIDVVELTPALKQSKKVIDKSNNRVFESISLAAKEIGCGAETLRRKLIGERINNTKFASI